MEILFTVDTYYPFLDGVSHVTQYLAEGLASKGHNVTVFTPKRNVACVEEVYNGVNIRRFNIDTRSGIFYGELNEYRKSVVMQANKSDVYIVVNLQCASGGSILSVLDKIKCRKVLFMHGIWDFSWHKHDFKTPLNIIFKLWANLRWKILYSFNNKKIKQYDRIIQLYRNSPGYTYFSTRGFNNQFILTNAVEESFFDISPDMDIVKNLGISGRYLLCVGNFFDDRKNQEFLIRAFYQIKSSCTLVLVGSTETDYSRKLTSLAEKLTEGSDNKVKILYGITRSEIYSLTRLASIYLMGSKWEEQPVSIFEAMASSVPFISTDVGCLRYLPGGVIVKNELDMAYWIDSFMENEEIRLVYGKLGYLYADDNCRKNKQIRKFEKLISE